MEITLKDILTTYWAQTVLLLAALGFLLKRILEIQTKKAEIKHSIFQQNRNTAIVQFFNIYIELQKTYRQILSETFDRNKIGNSDFDKLIEEKYEQLYASYFYFKILLDPLEQARYVDLVASMQNIMAKIKVTSVEIYAGDRESLIKELTRYIAENLDKNATNIKVIGQMFRENADKHFPIKLK